jgi:signal transduction histidine kinase/CheY-like chemotaxis protein
METQFHDVNIDYSDARSWLASLALMAAFSFFHIGPPVQFIAVWLLAFLYYFLRILAMNQYEVPPPLVSMASTIVPLMAIWIIVNTWWFRIRLQYTEAIENLKAANAKLTEIDRFRSNFFAGISHEFRTPLTLILSPLQSFIEKTEDEESVIYLRSVRKNGNRLLTLVNNLIDLARLDSGRMDLHLEAVDVCELVRGILAIFDQSFRSRGLSLRSELPLQLLTRVDVEKTETILINLLANALKFTDQGGATVRVKQQSHLITISVEDSGPGIAPDHRQLLFERFGAVRTPQSGSGLGLALSRELARFMNGDLTLRSSGAAGSTFELTLPLYPILFNEKQSARITTSFSMPEEMSALPAASAESESDRPLVLIVEDDAELRQYLHRITDERFNGLTASDGEQAFELATDRTPDAVVTDIIMPSMDGFELLQRFRGHRELRNIPFLFLTARAGLEDRLEGLRLGGDDYLVKPFDPPELLEKVSALIRRKQREEEGLRSERQSLVGDLHDMVGSDLTDLLIVLDSMKPDDAPGHKVENARRLARSVLGALRDRIHEREDMQLIQDNFMHGVKVILNRRYAAVGRGVRFRFNSDEEERFVEHLSLHQRHALYAVFLEISTNDLKYGQGISTWELSYRNGTLRATFQAQSTHETVGRLTFIRRLRDEGGVCSEKD